MHSEKGIINGAMLFDKQNLAPTYRLKVGKPGSSYAFEVAKKVGLSHHVWKYATKKVGKAENQVEELLIDLQDGKAILDEQLHYVEAERKKLDKLIQSYNEMAKEYEVKRKKLKIKAKEIEYKRANEEISNYRNSSINLKKKKMSRKSDLSKNKHEQREIKNQKR